MTLRTASDIKAAIAVDHTAPFMNAVSIYSEALAIADNKRTLNLATLFTNNIFTLAKVAKHIAISRQYFNNPSQKFQSIADALDAANAATDSILISFANIGLYAVYTPAEYASFLPQDWRKFRADTGKN